MNLELENEKKLLKFFEDYVNFFEEILKFEIQNLNVILENDLNLLNESIVQKQSNIMKVEDIEQKREKIQDELGFSKMKFSEIVDKVSSKNKKNFERLFNKFKETITEIKFLNFKSDNLLKQNLEIINKNSKNKVNTSSTYTKDKKFLDESNNHKFIEKKI